jgi:hypothetical protein
MASTLLSIDGIDFSDYASRGITMSLQPVDAGALEVDVNGNLVDMTLPQFRKYEATVECTDHEAPDFTDIWRGTVVEVVCIPQLGPSDSTDGTLTMSMMVDTWNTGRDEWQSEVAWSLHLRQI